MERLIKELERVNKPLLICHNNVKKRLLKRLDEIIDIIYKTPEEAINDLLGCYDDIALYEIKRILNTNYNHAKKIFDHLVVTKNVDDEIIKEVLLVKDKLKQYYHPQKEYNRKIIVIGKMSRFLFKALENYEVINYRNKEINNVKLFEYKTTIEEVEALANRIAKLIENKENDIEVYYNNPEYIDIIKDIFPSYNLAFNIDDGVILYDIPIVKRFVNENLDIEEIKDEKIKNKIIQAINNLVEIDYTKEDLIDELKQTKYNVKKEGIKIYKYDEFNSFSEHTFIIGKNNNIIPKTYKNTEYYSDEIYKKLGVKTALDMNIYEHNYFDKTIKQCQNVIISYAKFGINVSYDDANIDYPINKDNKPIEYSYKRANLAFMKEYYRYLKYNVVAKNLPLYNSVFNYQTYDNSYKRIDKKLIKDVLLKNNKISLSYTRLDDYLVCPYKYYAKYILSLNERDTKAASIGNYFHVFLENYYNGKSFEEANEIALENIELDDIYKEKYLCYAQKATKEIDSQMAKIAYDKQILERKYEKEFGDIILNGKIDKLLLKGSEAIVIDYKSKSDERVDIDKETINQLIIYAILLDKYNIAGLFLQHIMPKTLEESRKEDFYKLNGYYNGEHEEFGEIAKAKPKEKKDFEERKKAALEEIEKAKERMLAGEFDITPGKGCLFCPYNILCFKRKEGANNGMDK